MSSEKKTEQNTVWVIKNMDDPTMWVEVYSTLQDLNDHIAKRFGSLRYLVDSNSEVRIKLPKKDNPTIVQTWKGKKVALNSKGAFDCQL